MDGVNWYAYCGGNPVGMIDPSGLTKNEPTTSWGTNGNGLGDVTTKGSGTNSGNDGSKGGSTSEKSNNDREITDRGNEYTKRNSNGDLVQVVTWGFSKIEIPIKEVPKSEPEKEADREQEIAKSASAESELIVTDPTPNGIGQKAPGADRPSDGDGALGDLIKDIGDSWSDSFSNFKSDVSNGDVGAIASGLMHETFGTTDFFEALDVAFGALGPTGALSQGLSVLGSKLAYFKSVSNPSFFSNKKALLKTRAMLDLLDNPSTFGEAHRTLVNLSKTETGMRTLNYMHQFASSALMGYQKLGISDEGFYKMKRLQESTTNYLINIMYIKP